MPDQTKHASETWTAVKHETLKDCYTLQSSETHADGFKVVVAYAYGVSAADIAKIAAAPELLAALAECITEPGAACFANDDLDRMFRRLRAINETARAAIAKAK